MKLVLVNQTFLLYESLELMFCKDKKPCAFLHFQGKNVRLSQAQALTRHTRRMYFEGDRNWMIVFPEGGFLRKRKENGKRFAS